MRCSEVKREKVLGKELLRVEDGSFDACNSILLPSRARRPC